MSSKFPFSQPCFKFQPSFLLPQPLATLMTHSHVTVSHFWRLTNFLWPGTIWTGTTYYLLHDVILSPVSGGFPKKYICRGPPSLLSQNRHGWLLPPLPAYSSQFCSCIFPRPFCECLPSKVRHSWPLQTSQSGRIATWPSSPQNENISENCVLSSPYPKWGQISLHCWGITTFMNKSQTFRAGIALRD